MTAEDDLFGSSTVSRQGAANGRHKPAVFYRFVYLQECELCSIKEPTLLPLLMSGLRIT